MLYFDEVVYPISLYAKEICEKYRVPYFNSITTNGSKINENMIEKIKHICMFNFQITIDGDKEKHDKVKNENGHPSFIKIIENINLLCDMIEDVKIILRVNYDNNTLNVSDFDNVFTLINGENRKKVSVNFQRVWQTFKQSDTENQTRINWYEYCGEIGFKQKDIANVFEIGNTHKCYVDRIFHAEINYDGKVYRCTARDYSDKYVMGHLDENGEIIWNENEMSQRYGKATCENEMCLACKYLPLCMGPCSQKIVETSIQNLKEICCLNTAEIRPETVIVDYYKQKIEYNKLNDK